MMFTFRISYELLPIKANIFLFNAAQACHLSYWAVSGRQAGLSAALIGYVFGVAPLAAVAIKLIAGYIADRTRSLSGVLIITEVLLLLSTWAIFLSPVLHASHGKLCAVGVQYADDVNQTELSSKIAAWCSDGCWVRANLTDNLSNLDECNKRCVHEQKNCVEEAKAGTATIALFSSSLVMAYALTASIYSLSDTATYEVLGPSRADLFGRQRLWGTVSWGALSPFIGLLIDAASPWIPYGTNFLPAVMLFTLLIAANMVLLCVGPRFRTSAVSEHFFKDLTRAFKDVRVNLFVFWAFMSGVIMGVQWTYSVWRLEDLQASKALIGLTLAVQSFAGEMPIFFAVGRFVKQVGHFGCVATSFGCSACKLLGYAFMQDARFALLIDVAGGAAFPLLCAALTAFANVTAPRGTSATVQSVFSAVFEGIGVATGNYVCSQLIERYSIGDAFRWMGTVALVCAACCPISGFLLQKRRPVSLNLQDNQPQIDRL